MPAKLFKYGGEKSARVLYSVITTIWEEEKLPEEWMDGVVCPIYKKDARDKETVKETTKRAIS